MRTAVLILRSVLRARAFAIAAVVTFALGIGVNSAVFGAANAVLLDPIPGLDVRSVLSIETNFERGDLRHARVSPSNVWGLSDRRDVFTAVGGYRLAKVTLRDAGETAEIDAATTVGGFFAALGARPLLGRLYDANDAEHGDRRIVVLSYEFWQATFGADSSVIGRTLRLDDSTYRVVAVLPPGASHPRHVALWTPRELAPGLELARQSWAALLVTTIGRPRPDVSIADVHAALERQTREEAARHPELAAASDAKLVTRPLADALAGQLRPILFAILVCAGLVLLMACANVAGLQLVRASALSKELAVRAALGATRWALARQVAAESLLVAVMGGALGLALGQIAIGLIRRSSAAEFTGLADLRLDPPVVATLFALILAAGALSAVASVRLTTRIDAADVLRASSRGASAGRNRDRFLRAVVVTQLALAIVLLLGATTAVRSLERLTRVNPGFDPVGVTAVRIILPSPRYGSARLDSGKWNPGNVAPFFGQLSERLRQRAGFAAVGLVSGAPFGHVQNNEHKTFVTLEGETRKPTDPLTDFWRVDPHYFRAMGIPLRAGRTFTATDDARIDPIVVIDEVLARRLFSGRDPIGQRFAYLGHVVGVVATVKKADLSADDVGAVYTPMAPWAANDLTVVVRATGSAANVGTAVRAAVRDLDPTLAIGDVTSVVAGIERSLSPQRFSTQVVLAFSSLSLVLAVVGVCGVMLYGVSQRTKELGIRLALGATPEAMRRLVLLQGARLTGVGLAIGIVVYWAIAGALSTIVYGLSPRDPITLVGGVVALSAIALVAAYLPAHRASRVDPVRSLSSE